LVELSGEHLEELELCEEETLGGVGREGATAAEDVEEDTEGVGDATAEDVVDATAEDVVDVEDAGGAVTDEDMQLVAKDATS